MPQMALRRAVLPAPFGPTNAVSSSSPISKDVSLTTFDFPNEIETPLSDSDAFAESVIPTTSAYGDIA
jgi:hypothetical protein